MNNETIVWTILACLTVSVRALKTVINANVSMAGRVNNATSTWMNARESRANMAHV